MKVCMITTAYPRFPGDYQGIFLHKLAKALVKEGLSIHVVVPHGEDTRSHGVMEGVHIHRFHYFWPKRFETLTGGFGVPENLKKFRNKLLVPFFMISMGLSLLRIVKRHKIDVINAHWAIPPGFVAAYTQRLHKRPVLLTLYGAELFPIKEGRFKQAKPFISYAIRKVRTVVGISDATCNYGKELSGKEDIEILPDGIDTERFNPGIHPGDLRKQYDLNNSYFLFSSGRMVERKGFEYLIKAMPTILEKFPDTKLIIGGDGPERRNLEELIKTLELERNVFLPGFLAAEEFPLFMKACDVFILPSIIDRSGDTEGSATILLEAMACETPVVGTNVGGIPYAITDGEGGFIVDQKSSEQIAEKIILLLEDESLRRKMGERGRKVVKERFDWEIVARRYVGEFKKLQRKSVANNKS